MASAGRISKGTVTERSPGHWQVRVPAGFSEDGKRDVYAETLPPKHAALIRRDELMLRDLPGVFTVPDSQPRPSA
jgi:hypothetical protein